MMGLITHTTLPGWIKSGAPGLHPNDRRQNQGTCMPDEETVERREIYGGIHKRVINGDNKYSASIFQFGMIDISG